MRRRGRSKANPSGVTLAVLGGGLALLGIGVYFATRSSSSTSASTAVSAKAPIPSSRPFGDPNDTSSVAFACNACRKLLNVGQTAEAAVWQQKCVAGGGTVPASMATLYT